MKHLIMPPKEKILKLRVADPDQTIFCQDRYYSFIHRFLHTQRIKQIFRLLEKEKYKDLLDIGCGGGFLLPLLEEKTENLWAVDKHNGLQAVKEILEVMSCRAKIIYGEAENLPFQKNKFDCITCISVMQFIPDTDKALSEIARVAKPGAKIAISSPVHNILTELLYSLIGKRGHGATHASNPEKIINSTKKYLNVKKITTIPAFLPLKWSIFFTVIAEKK